MFVSYRLQTAMTLSKSVNINYYTNKMYLVQYIEGCVPNLGPDDYTELSLFPPPDKSNVTNIY